MTNGCIYGFTSPTCGNEEGCKSCSSNVEVRLSFNHPESKEAECYEPSDSKR